MKHRHIRHIPLDPLERPESPLWLCGILLLTISLVCVVVLTAVS